MGLEGIRVWGLRSSRSSSGFMHLVIKAFLLVERLELSWANLNPEAIVTLANFHACKFPWIEQARGSALEPKACQARSNVLTDDAAEDNIRAFVIRIGFRKGFYKGSIRLYNKRALTTRIGFGRFITV